MSQVDGPDISDQLTSGCILTGHFQVEITGLWTHININCKITVRISLSQCLYRHSRFPEQVKCFTSVCTTTREGCWDPLLVIVGQSSHSFGPGREFNLHREGDDVSILGQVSVGDGSGVSRHR